MFSLSGLALLLTGDQRERVNPNKQTLKIGFNQSSCKPPPPLPSTFPGLGPRVFRRPRTKFALGQVDLHRGQMGCWRVLRKLQFVRKLTLSVDVTHIYLNDHHTPDILNRAEVQLWHVSSVSVQEMCWRVSRKYLGRNMKCGSLRAPSRSPFREMEWKNSVDGAISYPSQNPGLGFLPLISSHPLSLHLRRLLRMYMYLCRCWLALIYGYVDTQ